MYSSACKRIFKRIENVNENTIVLFGNRPKIFLFRELQAVGEYKYKMIADPFSTECFHNCSERRFRPISSIKKRPEIVMNATEMGNSFFYLVHFLNRIGEEPRSVRIVILRRREEEK